LPGLLMLVAEGFRRANNTTMRDATLERLQQDFPNSEEARNAAVATR